MTQRIGLDFDNTIVCYDRLFYELALDRGWIRSDIFVAKEEIRNALRRQAGGERRWQILQAEAYGPRIQDASPFRGVREFIKIGINRGIEFFIVSHKSRFAAQDIEQSHDLIAAAEGWLEKYEIVGEKNPIPTTNVYFEPTRERKVVKVGQLGCEVFVDDLQETFHEPKFPVTSRKILIGKKEISPRANDIETYLSWAEVTKVLFDNTH